ncbi:MAG: Cof-type HAD-IIB family hydrolase [Roseiflexaceae bacterium]
MTYKLLALDLDGTTIDHDLHIRDSIISGIARIQAAGVHVTIATGRMFAATIPFAKQLGITGPVICYQGGMIRHATTGAELAHFPMPALPAAEATAALLADDLFVVAYINERLCVAGERPELQSYLAYHPHHVEVVIEPNLPALVAEQPPTKLLFVAEPEVVGRTLAKLSPPFEGRLATTRSHELFGEFTAVGVSKGAALAALAEQLGIAQAEVVAIGDQENDLSMIAWAGLGLAMGNAIAPVKAIAQAILPPVSEAGVAYAIKHYFPTVL